MSSKSLKRPFSSIAGGDGGDDDDDDVGSGVADTGDGVEGVSENGGEKAASADADDGSGGVGAAAESVPAEQILFSYTPPKYPQKNHNPPKKGARKDRLTGAAAIAAFGDGALMVAGFAGRSRRIKKAKSMAFPSEKDAEHECYIDGCSKTFPTVRKMNAHARKHTSSHPFTCSIAGCHRKFMHASALKARK
jgi:hypothetical protein